MQRQLAIQRLQEQEKERQMRLEQQKQTVQMRAQMPAFPLPYAQAGAAHPALPIIGQRHPSDCWFFFVSSSRLCPQLGVYSTSPQAQPAFLAPLAQQAQ